MNNIDFKQENKISGKRILFFGLETFGYEKKILGKMQKAGAAVEYYNERAVTSKFGKTIIKFAPVLLNKKVESYYQSIIEKHSGQEFDIIFIMKCDVPMQKTLKALKDAFPNAEMRLHVWDSLSNIIGIENKLPYFDRVTSFDRIDCLNHPEFGFRPLFFADDFADDFADNIKNSDSKKYDISFCGTIHTDRYPILESIHEQCKKENLSFYGYYYLQSKLAYYYLKLKDKRYRKAPQSAFYFESIGSTEVNKIFQESNAVVDIQHPNQAGLTMRTIETFGAKKKLITTNKDIVNYDFYSPENICVIDRDHPVVPKEFLMTPYADVPADIYKKYSLTQWVADVLTM